MTSPGLVERPPKLARLAERLPPWLGSIRVRLTFLYSILLFGLAAIVVGLIYVGLSESLDDQPVSPRESVIQIFQTPEGAFLLQPTEREVPDYLALFEREVNSRALDNLRRYSFYTLGGLFVASLGIGWFVAGMVLRPIGRITNVAKEIQATDLSRRIHLRGPKDELRELADTFDEMLGRLDHAFDSQRQFIHEASHELRNPLAVIRANLDVTLGDPEVDEAELRHMGEVVGRSAERMSTLVEDLLEYARQGTTAERREVADLAKVVEDTVADFRAAAEARSIEIVSEHRPGLYVAGDAGGLRRALANLLANATRLAPEGSTITVTAGELDGERWFAVADEGPGIAPELAERVFQRFFRGPDQSASSGRSGLGLTIVRHIAEGHGGRAEVAPNGEGGSTFTIWLPALEHPVLRSVEHEPDPLTVALGDES